MHHSTYNPENDSKALYKAMKGSGTDEDVIIKVICNRSNQQRQEILAFYKASYGQDLKADLKDELGGNFETAVLALFETAIMYDTKEIRRAIKGAGTNEDTLIEILGSRSTKRIKEIKEAYLANYGGTLEEAISDETSGDLKNMIVSLLQCNRSENVIPDNSKCLQDAQNLYDAGEGQWGTEESVFNKIFALRSPYELGVIARHYNQISSGKSLFQVIESEFSGDILKLLKTMLQAMINPHAFFAARINQSVKGWGTNDELLIRILVSRDEVDMPDIKRVYKELYGNDMLEDIKDDCSGDYKNLLVELASH